MASGSKSRSRGSGAGGSSSSRARAAEAPSALLAPQLNPKFDAMPAEDLVSHLNRSRRADDFVDVALVLADRERRHAENEGRLRWSSERINSLLDEMREREYSALEAEAQISRATETEAALRAKISRADETEAALRDKISRADETEAALRDKISRADETEKALRDKISRADETQKALRDKISRADETEKALRDKISRADETEKALRGKIRTLQLTTSTLISGLGGTGLSQQAAGHGREPVPQDFITASTDGVGFADATGVQTMIAKGDLVAAMLVRHGELTSDATPHLVAAPLPGMPIVDDEQQVATEVPRSNDEAQGNREVSEDVLSARVTVGHDKVSEEVALEEDVAASLNRHSKGEEPETATKNAPKHKGTLQLGAAALIPSGINRFSLTQQDAGLGREPVPQEDYIKAMFAPRLWSCSAPHLVAAPLMPLSSVAPHLFATSLPGTLTDDGQRAALQVATEVLSSNKEAQQGDREVSDDVLTERVTPGRHKVSEEVAQGEDVAASVHRRSQGEWASRVTKKARSHRHHAAGCRSSWLQLAVTALISSDISGPGPTQQVAGHGREPVPQDFITASDASVCVDDATGVQTMFAQGESSNAVPKKMRHGELWSLPTSQLVAAPLMRPGPGPSSRAAPHLVVAPVPSTLIVDDEKAAEQVAIEVLSSDEEVLEYFRRARVTSGRRRKVSEEAAQGEDVASRSSQGEHVARASKKKVRKHKGTSFNNQVFSALKEKEELLLKKKEERLGKEAASAAASKQKQVHCRCWLKARNISSQSAAEEDSGDGSQN